MTWAMPVAGQRPAPRQDGPQVAVDGFTQFAVALHAALPTTKLLYLAIKPSPARLASG